MHTTECNTWSCPTYACWPTAICISTILLPEQEHVWPISEASQLPPCMTQHKCWCKLFLQPLMLNLWKEVFMLRFILCTCCQLMLGTVLPATTTIVVVAAERCCEGNTLFCCWCIGNASSPWDRCSCFEGSLRAFCCSIIKLLLNLVHLVNEFCSIFLCLLTAHQLDSCCHNL